MGPGEDTETEPQMQKILIKSLILGALLMLAGCGSVGFPGLYRINVEQGNVVNQEMVDQLKPGMTKRQVRFVMGTPIVADTFDQSRWDYVYRFKTPRGKTREKHITLHFDGDLLASFEGDFLPSDTKPTTEEDSQ